MIQVSGLHVGRRGGASLSVLAALICASGALAQQDDEPASKSHLGGIVLPPGARRLLAQAPVAQAQTVLERILKPVGAKPESVEVLMWSTASLAGGTDGLMQSVADALRKGGYQCQLVDVPAGAPAAMKKLLAATRANERLIGFWASTAAITTLDWCRVSGGQSAQTGAPSESGDTSAPPTFHPTPSKPHYLIGITVDRSGKPLAGVDVNIHGTTISGGERTNLAMTSGGDGHYKLPLPAGVYSIEGAYYHVTYHELPYVLKLRAETGPKPVHFSSDDGYVANFYVKLTGQIDPAYDKLHYGGDVNIDISQLQQRLGQSLAQAELVVELTPDGPLVDGSAGWKVVRRVPIDLRNSFKRFVPVTDVPVGVYHLALQITASGQSAPLRPAIDASTNGIDAASGAADDRILFRPAEGGIEGTRSVMVHATAGP